jgi:hypothetical protein
MSDQERQGENRPGGLIGGIFTRENLAIGWSSIWHGVLIGAPLMALLVWVGRIAPYNLLILAVAWVPIRWAWRQLGGHSMGARVFLTILLAAWVLFVPLNYAFNLSCRRAVHMHRGIEVGPLSYLFGFVIFAAVWAAAWLATGWPVSKFFGIIGDPEVWQARDVAVVGIWVVLALLLVSAIYGRVISAMADRFGSPVASDTPTA